MKQHTYQLTINWIGNLGSGTSSYTAYSRNHNIQAADKPLIPGSSDPSFRGDPKRYNPEELFLSTLSSCHMLFFLHLCAVNKITVVNYSDQPEGIMLEEKSGRGFFKEVTLHPVAEIKEADKVDLAMQLHKDSSKLCFIANSVNFPVKHQPIITIATDG